MNTYKVTYTGSTPQAGEIFHESEDLLSVGIDALEKGVVVDGVWIHPDRIASIQIVPVPSAPVVRSSDESQPPALIPVSSPTLDGGVLPVDGSEPTDETETASSETVVPITNPDLTGVPGDGSENPEANPEPTQLAQGGLVEDDPIDPNAAIPVTVVSNPVMAVPNNQ